MSADAHPGLEEGPLRVLACLDQTPAASIVARHAGRLARELRAPWEAVHVATPISQRASKPAREALPKGFRLAEELGAETRSLNGDDQAAEILAHARSRGVTHIVLGAPSHPIWMGVFAASVPRRILREAGEMAVEICPREPKEAGALIAEAVRPPSFADPVGYVFATLFVAIAASTTSASSTGSGMARTTALSNRGP